jgi:hypothetical protein
MPDDDLKTTLELRAAVIQHALRSGKIGEQELDPLLMKPTWRKDLYEAIENAVPKIAGEGTGFTGQENAPSAFTYITDESTAWWTPRQLLMQYTIATRLNESDNAGLQNGILRIYEAFGLELLAGRQLRGRSAAESLLESLRVTLKVTGIAEQRITRLSAFQELFRILSTTAAQGRRTILLRLVGDVDGIVALVAAAPPAGSSPGIQWLRRLRRLLGNDRAAAAERLLALVESREDQQGALSTQLRAIIAFMAQDRGALSMTSEPLDWLYDFDLLGEIVDAVRQAKQAVRGPQPDLEDLSEIGAKVPLYELADRNLGRQVTPSRRSIDATKDDDAAETLVQNQRRLVADAAEILCDPDPDPVRANNLAEELWWRSFEVEENDWRAKDVATFCLGRERATWLTSGAPAPTNPRVNLANVGPASEQAPSVVIFGAGIAGLTAAHELAERGIQVTVVDAAMPHCKLPGMQSNVGGMARTQWAHGSPWPRPDGAGAKSERLFPGEHGYRLFPSFYRHVFDTMKRTPILGVDLDVQVMSQRPPVWPLNVRVSPDQLGIRPTAFDQLQATHEQVFARRGQFVRLRRDRPRSLEAFRTEYMNLHEGLGFPKRDMARFFFKLLRYLMTCSERRAAEYETQSLLAFFDPSLYSEGFIKAIKSAPQALVAMDAELCDARTQGNVYIQLLLDQILGSEYTDSTLRGPTSVAWFDHWYRYLESLNVKFINAELLALRPARLTRTQAATPARPQVGAPRAADERPAQTRATTPFEVVFKTAPGARDTDLERAIGDARYIVVALDAVSAERVTRSWESGGVPFELRGYASWVTEKLRGPLARYDVVITFKPSLSRTQAEDVMHRLLDRISVVKDDPTRRPSERSAFRNLYRATGQVPIPPGDVDEIQIALWFEQSIGKGELRAIERVLASLLRPDSEDLRLLSDQPTWVNTPTTIATPRMPDDVFGEHTTDRFQTFIGVQYYFAHDFKLVRGHVYLPDTEWGLSAVSQGQFWPQRSIPEPKQVRGILSIDIGNCRRKSSYMHRTVMECTREDIATEVWRQFTDSLRSTRGPTSIVTSLPLPEPIYYHVDDNLVFTRDQGAFRSNRTPFLVNNAGDWERRPRCQPWVPGRPIVVDAPRTDATDVWQAPHGGYRIHAGSVVFCGTYMRTFTRMTTMEAANESARHAVNAILDHSAAYQTKGDYQPIAGDYCDIWDPEEYELDDLDFFKRIDKLLFEAGKPHIADILQFDKIADLQYPDPSPIQALVAALGSTIKSDWGMTSTELVTSLDGLLKSAKQVVGGIAGAASEHPLLKLLGMLGIGKGGPPRKGS